MTRSYDGKHFTEPQFVVLANRLGALLVSGLGLSLLGRLMEPAPGANILLPPLSSYSLPAFTNIISSWCQYEALFFISFPLQVVSKSCKILPVMAVGFLLHRRSYSLIEYVTAGKQLHIWALLSGHILGIRQNRRAKPGEGLRCCVCLHTRKTRFSEQGQLEEVGVGYTFFWSGRLRAERRDAGVAFAIRNDIVGCLPQGLISAGVSLVVISSPVNAQRTSSATFDSLSGCVLILGYILCDSLTATTEEHLFKMYRLSVLKMMFGCGCWAAAFTVVSLAGKNSLASSVTFAQEHPLFLTDVTLSALCSGLGQILIFLTISRFGAATFVIIMTIRQALSILVSCIIFDHSINTTGLFGFCVTFSAVFFRIFYRNRRSTPTNISP
ncbi:unnamed protein product [Schistocephalus solidus]|uniref:Adenosine 3'-phospho 5'-phosphosulfate transporter 1 n=1 Tax=Schistocephalus solidus TaxID=70667 RepID=A0A183SF86_SCHSO|nr:unnamed protein product [Schistocephalus solidus]